MHLHVCVVNGVFEQVQGGDADNKATSANVIFHPASEIDESAVAQAQATLRKRILRAFVGRGLLASFDAQEMLAYQHSGFSVDAGVCIEAHDRAGLERLPPWRPHRARTATATLVCWHRTRRSGRR